MKLGTLIGVVMTLSNTSLGAAILQLPFRFAALGVPLGITYWFLSTVFSLFLLTQLARLTHKYKAKNVTELITKTAGKKGMIILSISNTGMFFAVITVYIIIGGDYLKTIWVLIKPDAHCSAPDSFDTILCEQFRQCQGYSKKLDIYTRLIVGGCIFMLESFIGDLRVLNTISSAAVVIVLFTLIALAYRTFQSIITNQVPFLDTYINPEPKIPVKPSLIYALTSIPSFFQLYGAQMTITPIYNDLKEENYKTVKWGAIISIILTSLLYLLFGIFGIIIFYGQNQGRQYHYDNILLIFSPNDILMTIARVSYSIVIIVSFPAIIYGMRSVIMSWFNADRTLDKKGKLIFYLSGIIIVIFATILAIIVPQISIVLDLFGAIFGILIFILIPLLIIIYEDSQPDMIDSPIEDKNHESRPRVSSLPLGEGNQGQLQDLTIEDNKSIEYKSIKPINSKYNIFLWCVFGLFTVIGLNGLGFTINEIIQIKEEVCKP
ncbi:Amino acid transporter family protein [Spironucleus salmonicida]|uniref:Amino acid transporter family protein n=1 Tax=Spironucleus salmonicida TaxID=348837 RepID=V6LC68_9EUKA|nr:Amino acid transporter family protein [Spironucleus salmonicida]|eukprot:EST41828.1 Amino acid transporter family protein [Spironucleus salmonicida]